MRGAQDRFILRHCNFEPLFNKTHFLQMKQLLYVFIAAFCLHFSDSAQSYKSAIGPRLGYPTSISFKHFISEPGAIEVFGGFRSYSLYKWYNVGAMYEHHKPIPKTTLPSHSNATRHLHWNEHEKVATRANIAPCAFIPPRGIQTGMSGRNHQNTTSRPEEPSHLKERTEVKSPRRNLIVR